MSSYRGPVGPSSLCRYQYKGKIPSFHFNSAPIVENHVLKVLREQGFSLDVERDNKSVPDPNELFVALARYQDPEPMVVDDSLKIAIGSAMKVFGGYRQLRPLQDQLSLRGSLKLDKSSGAPLFQSKEDAFGRDFNRAQKIKSGTKRVIPPCVCYHRVQHGGEGPKTRLVWGYPLSMTIVEATFARPLIDWFLDTSTPMAFGLRRNGLMARAMPITNSNVRFGLDASKFDSSLKPYLIKAAFQILRTHFEENSPNDEVWSIIEEYFIHTPILMPDGYVYKKHQGVPSGSYFTQMVDSICNYILVQAIFHRLTGATIQADKILVLGDDSLVGSSKYYSLHAIQSIAKEYRITVNVTKSHVSRFGQAFEFLGHSWQHGVPRRNVQELAKRLVFPEKISGIDDPFIRRRTRLVGIAGDAMEGIDLMLAFGLSPKQMFRSQLRAELDKVQNG